MSSGVNFEEAVLAAYEGELLGVELFRLLAEREPDARRRTVLQALQLLEEQTRDALTPLVAGRDVDKDGARRGGAVAAEALADRAWADVLADFLPVADEVLERYEHLQSTAPDAGHPGLVGLVAHERALRDFAAFELGGRPDDALAAVIDQLDDIHRGRLYATAPAIAREGSGR